MKLLKITLVLLIMLAFMSIKAHARIKLVTLPSRDRVIIRLDHPSRVLVEETRTVPLQKDSNKIDFSWANVHIDSNSIQFKVVKSKSDVKVISVSYPPNENALTWDIWAAEAGSCTIKVSYLISNIRKTVSYRAIAEHDEKSMTLKCYIKVHNLSGERFKDAEFRIGYGNDFIKSIEHSEAKQMLSAKFLEVPITKQYIFDASKRKETSMYYIIKNDKQNNLGNFPLPYGKFRIFQKDGHGGVAFIGEDWGKMTPIGEEMKLYLGLAKEIVIKRYQMERKKINVRGRIYDLKEIYKFSIENFKKVKVKVHIVEHPSGYWEAGKKEFKQQIGEDEDVNKREEPLDFSKYVKVEKKDVNNVIYKVELNPTTKEKKYILYYTIYRRNLW